MQIYMYVQSTKTRREGLPEEEYADTLKELEKVLLEKGYSKKVKDAIIDWYSSH